MLNIENQIYFSKLRELSFRRTATLYMGCVVNTTFAAFNTIMSIAYHSCWYAAIAIYYVVLALMRAQLIHNKQQSEQIEDKKHRISHEYYGYRQCGYMMLALNASATGVIIQITRHNMGYYYPKLIIGVYALYALIMLNIAFRNMLKYRRDHNPNFSAARGVSFSMALMSILSLQTAMFAQFGRDSRSFALGQALNISLGNLICLSLLGMAIYMIVRANKKLNELEN